jgi:putative aldouronate transport system substrate-binding protein
MVNLLLPVAFLIHENGQSNKEQKGVLFLKKLLTVLLALVMVLALFAGCGKDSPEPSKAPVDSKPSSQPVDSPSDDEGDDTEDSMLPIVDEKMEFEMFATVFLAEQMVDLNDGYAFQELENRTNIHIKWTIPSLASGAEQFNLMLMSGDYPDAVLVNQMSSWVGGLDANVDDGFILDITDLVPQYAPNYNALRTKDPAVRRDTTTDLGRVVSLRPIYPAERQPTYSGPVFRQDLLDKAGYTGELVTIDDWYNALTALKAVVDKEPFYFVNRTYHGIDQDIATAFDVATTQTGYIQVDGKIEYSFITEGMREYLRTMNKWYSEGLIDKDFAARTNNMRADYTDILSNNHAAFQCVFTYIDNYESQGMDPGYELTPVRLPVRQKGDSRHVWTMGGRMNSGVTTLFPDCHNPEIMLRWFDYLYTEEGALLFNYGLEGQGHTIVDGKPMLTELVVANPDGIGMSQALSLFTFPAPFPGALDWRREFTNYMSEKSINANFLWTEDADLAYELSDSVTMTLDEMSHYNQMHSDINTFVTEQVPRFIIGDLSVDSDWDAYVAEIEHMGIEQCIEYWQNAFDRYMAR